MGRASDVLISEGSVVRSKGCRERLYMERYIVCSMKPARTGSEAQPAGEKREAGTASQELGRDLE